MEGMCCVDRCDRKQNSDESVLFHKFPKNGALKRSWLESIPMKKDIPRILLVCSDHFLESDYKHVRGKKILNLDNAPTVFTKVSKDPDKENDDKVIESDDEVPLKRKSEEHVYNTPTFTKISEDLDKNGDDKVIKSDDEVLLKRKTKEHFDNTPTFTKTSEDPDRNSDDKVIKSDDEVLLKIKSNKHVDNTPTLTKTSEDPDKNGHDKIIESDEEVLLKRKSKDTDKNDDDKGIESDDEVPLKRKTKDPDKNIDDEEKETETHFKRKTRRRVSKVKCKNRRDKKPSDSVIINKNDEESNVNKQLNNNINRISEQLSKSVNIEVKKADFFEFDQKLDLEDNIPSFIIKDNKPRQMVEINVPPCDVEVVPETTEVVNIEVSVDPTLLMMDEPSVVEEIELSDDSDIEITPIEKQPLPTDPVSLLTSSDEDEVIYLEPKYDMVEVSDETDEEDRPLIRFINKKLKDKPCYVCSKCDFKTDIHPKYVKHLRKHTIFICNMCGHTLKSKEQLTNHMRRHGLEKKFKCHLCSYKAKYQMSLILHVSTHKTYLRCKACPFMTWDRNILSRHRETHLLNRC